MNTVARADGAECLTASHFSTPCHAKPDTRCLPPQVKLLQTVLNAALLMAIKEQVVGTTRTALLLALARRAAARKGALVVAR